MNTDIRGQLLTPSPVGQVDSLEVFFSVFGKVKTFNIKSNEGFILSFKRSRRKIKRNPEIIISIRGIKPEWGLYLDAIDMGIHWKTN